MLSLFLHPACWQVLALIYCHVFGTLYIYATQRRNLLFRIRNDSSSAPLWKNKPRNIIIFQLRIHFVLLKNQLKLFQVYEVFRFFALSKMLYLAHLSHFNIPLLRIPTFLDKKQNNASSTVLENGISLENCQNREICFMNTIFSFWGFFKIFCGLPIFYDFLIVGGTKNDNFGSLCHVGLW